MSDRYIEVGEKKWKNPTEEAVISAVRWSTSQKGNAYTTHRGVVIVIMQNKWNQKWQYMMQPEAVGELLNPNATAKQNWEVHGKFDTQDEAKAAVLNALRPKREPVPPVPVDNNTASDATRGGRKIVL